MTSLQRALGRAFHTVPPTTTAILGAPPPWLDVSGFRHGPMVAAPRATAPVAADAAATHADPERPLSPSHDCRRRHVGRHGALLGRLRASPRCIGGAHGAHPFGAHAASVQRTVPGVCAASAAHRRAPKPYRPGHRAGHNGVYRGTVCHRRQGQGAPHILPTAQAASMMQTTRLGLRGAASVAGAVGCQLLSHHRGCPHHHRPVTVRAQPSSPAQRTERSRRFSCKGWRLGSELPEPPSLKRLAAVGRLVQARPFLWHADRHRLQSGMLWALHDRCVLPQAAS